MTDGYVRVKTEYLTQITSLLDLNKTLQRAEEFSKSGIGDDVFIQFHELEHKTIFEVWLKQKEDKATQLNSEVARQMLLTEQHSEMLIELANVEQKIKQSEEKIKQLKESV